MCVADADIQEQSTNQESYYRDLHGVISSSAEGDPIVTCKTSCHFERPAHAPRRPAGCHAFTMVYWRVPKRINGNTVGASYERYVVAPMRG